MGTEGGSEEEAGGPKGRAEPMALARAEQTAARRAAESKATIPHLYVRSQAPTLPAERAGLAPIVRALAAALREVPRLNSTYRDGALEVHSRVNIGIAGLAAQDALVPTVFDADRRPVAELESELTRLADLVGGGEATARDLSGATATLYAVGEAGVTSIDPVIVPGQAVALGAATGGGEEISLTLACDARVAGAARAARFLALLCGGLASGGSGRS